LLLQDVRKIRAVKCKDIKLFIAVEKKNITAFFLYQTKQDGLAKCSFTNSKHSN